MRAASTKAIFSAVKSVTISLLFMNPGSAAGETKNQNPLTAAPMLHGTDNKDLIDAMTSISILKLKPEQNCSDSTAHFCLPIKNPVFTRKQIYQETLTMGQDIRTEQVLPLKLNTLKKSPENILENSLFSVFADISSEGFFLPNQPRLDEVITIKASDRLQTLYKDDSKHFLAQAMAFQVANEQVLTFQKWGGTYFLRPDYFNNPKKKLMINAFDNTIANNAYYDPSEGSIHMGYALTTSSLTQTPLSHEMAFSGEVIAHELGHVHMDHALGNTAVEVWSFYNQNYQVLGLHCSEPMDKYYCKGHYDAIVIIDGDEWKTPTFRDDRNMNFVSEACNEYGCFAGLNEGLADMHANIQFLATKDTVMGATWANDLKKGIDSLSLIPRDVKANRGFRYPHFRRLSGKGITNYFISYVEKENNLRGYDGPVFLEDRRGHLSPKNRMKITLDQFKRMPESRRNLISERFGGMFSATGAFYASVLWEIFSTCNFSTKDFTKLFVNHLPLLTSTSTFSSALNSLLVLDQTLFNGVHSEKMNAVIKRRGINL